MELPDCKLPEELAARVTSICEAARSLSAGGDRRAARDRYWDAFDLIPEPREDFVDTTRILCAIGTMFHEERNFEDALAAFRDAVRCAGGLGDPYVHLRLGQAELELGDEPRAADDLMRAYMGGGPEAFDGEAPKYLDFLRTEVQRRGGTL